MHVHAGGDLEGADPEDALGGGLRRQGQDPRVLPQDRQDGRAGAVHALVQDDGVLVAASLAVDDDVAAAEGAHGAHGLVAALGAAPPGQVGLGLGDALAQLHVFGEIAEAAAHLLLQGGQGSALPAGLGGELDDAAVGLVLGEGGLQHLAGPGARGAPEQVDGHVVGGAEGRHERVGAPGGQRGDEGGLDLVGGQDDGVPLDVNAAPARPAGQLGVLPGAEGDVGRPVPLAQGFQDDGAGGHVDAQGQGLGGVDDLDQPGAEELLDGLLEDGQEAGVVGGHAPLEGVRPAPEPEHPQVPPGDLGRVPVDDLADPGRLGLGGQVDSGLHALVDGLLAAGAREHEHDRRQKIGPLERRDDRDP